MAGQSSSSSRTRRRVRRIGFDELAFATTTPSAASAPRSRIPPHTIPINLIVFDRPPDELSLDEELLSDEDELGGLAVLGLEESAGAGVEGAGVLGVNAPPAPGFVGSGGATAVRRR